MYKNTTYCTTCKKNGINSFDAIMAMFEGKPYTIESLNLVERMDYKEMYHPSVPPVPSELNTQLLQTNKISILPTREVPVMETSG